MNRYNNPLYRVTMGRELGAKTILLILTKHAVLYKELNLSTCGPTHCAREKPQQGKNPLIIGF